MALIKCPKCGKEISDKAKQCVGCGWKVEAIKDSKKKQTAKLRHTLVAKREKNFPSANILFMMVLALVMICFMIVVWRRLDKISAEIDRVTSNKQTESEMLANDMENGNEKKLEDNNEEEEISDSNLQSENVTDKNEQDEETEETFERVVPSEEDVVNVYNSNLKFEYTGNNVNGNYVMVYFKITNEGDVPIYLTMQRFHFLNDISIERAYSELDDEILPEKSSLLEICFNKGKIEAAGISTIDSFVCRYDTAEDANGKDLTSNEIAFDGLGINID